MPSLPVHLEWVAPAGCPWHEEILGVVERIVGANALRSAVDARVIVTQEERGFGGEVTVSASGATSTRRHAVSVPACAAESMTSKLEHRKLAPGGEGFCTVAASTQPIGWHILYNKDPQLALAEVTWPFIKTFWK